MLFEINLPTFIYSTKDIAKHTEVMPDRHAHILDILNLSGKLPTSSWATERGGVLELSGAASSPAQIATFILEVN
ncbi:hypothetical protein ACOTCB_23800 [Achromobacter xylosoxidans]